MANSEATMTVTKKELIVHIPWEIVAQHLRPKSYKTRFTVEDVLRLVEEGRQAHRLGKTRVISSLKDLRF